MRSLPDFDVSTSYKIAVESLFPNPAERALGGPSHSIIFVDDNMLRIAAVKLEKGVALMETGCAV